MEQSTPLSEKKMNTIQPETNENTTQKLPFSTLTKVYEQVGNTKGTNSKSIQKQLLSEMFTKLLKQSTQDLIRGYWLSIMKIGPDYEKSQLGIGKQILMKSVMNNCGMNEKQIRQKLRKTDLGTIASQSKSGQRTIKSFFKSNQADEPLTIEKVFKGFRSIADTKGSNSNSHKLNTLSSLIRQSTQQQTKFIIRWVQGNLGISAAQKTMQDSLISALFDSLVDKKNQTEQNYANYVGVIKKSTAEYPNDAEIIRNLIRFGNDYEQLADTCKLTLGIPCRPMLAKPTKGISEILNRFEGKKITCQYKYDGLRGQIHYNQGEIHIFSRNLENMTEAYADICNEINKEKQKIQEQNLKSFILDCEIVAINKKTNQLLPFQVLSTRARKATNVEDIDVNVKLFVFDILYHNGPLTHLPLRERRQKIDVLKNIFNDIIVISEHREIQEFDKIDEFLQEAIKFGTEGLMIKDLDSVYTCSRRSYEWVKLKKDYIDGVGDTLDVVPIGAFYGSGKRSGLYGSYLLAVYNSDMQQYQTLCKIGTGFSDSVLKAAYEFFQDKITPQKPDYYKTSQKADRQQKVDVWFNPAVVWQIKGADFQLSPVYTCGISDKNKGIGLRFPRLMKVREDKKPNQATTSDFVTDLYQSQAVVQNKKGNEEDIDDYY